MPIDPPIVTPEQVKRFDIASDEDSDCACGMEHDKHGDYVTYAAYTALLAERRKVLDAVQVVVGDGAGEMDIQAAIATLRAWADANTEE